ncbi:hypothetical protein C8R46DRAFT_1164635 [Mycena filopes]|nr:hypothetical protein C8R46DRAFT_1164635 [Mycena filopes]
MASPTDDELRDALVQLKAAHPALGIPKLHARLRTDFPSWTVSEKRVRKILAALAPPKPKPKADTTPHPSSQLVEGLDIAQWTQRVEVRVFDATKGKGLPREIYDKQLEAAACTHCTTLFERPPTIRCPHCPAAFCNTLCRQRADKIAHPLLCPAQNPAATPLLKWVRGKEWLALHALVRCAARLLLANAAGEGRVEADWAVVRGFAALGMEERARYSFRSEPDRETWKTAFGMFCRAFHRPLHEEKNGSAKSGPGKLTAEEKRVAALLQKPLPTEIEKALFEYEPGFLRGLGSMSLNLEAHGGLYTLHAHLNHACTPNVSADIPAGEELLITYVDPALGYGARRGEIEAWGFTCECARCVAEGRDWKPGEGEEEDLASELKAGLGLM